MDERKKGEEIEEREEQEEKEKAGEELILLKDVYLAPRMQLLQRESPDDLEKNMRRYTSAVLWAGDKVVRENIWEGFSASAVAETVRRTKEYEQVTKNFYTIDDSEEFYEKRNEKRDPRVGTFGYVGPSGKRPELFQSDVSSFFSRMALADVVVPAADAAGASSVADCRPNSLRSNHAAASRVQSLPIWSRLSDTDTEGGVDGEGQRNIGVERATNPVKEAVDMFLPGRREVERIQNFAYAARRVEAEEEEARSQYAQSLRGEWPGVPPRGMFEKVVLPTAVSYLGGGAAGSFAGAAVCAAASVDDSTTNPAVGGGRGGTTMSMMWQSKHEGELKETEETRVSLMEHDQHPPQQDDAEAGSTEWQQHVQSLGHFVLELGEDFSNVAALLARQSAEEGDGWSDRAEIEWLADSPSPDTSALLCLRLGMEPVLGFVAAESESAAEGLFAQLLPRFTAEWKDKPFLLTYPREYHDGIERVLSYGAHLNKHWLQPVSLYIAPGEGPRVCWKTLHPAYLEYQEEGGVVVEGASGAIGSAQVAAGSVSAAAGSVSVAAAFDALRRVSCLGCESC